MPEETTKTVRDIVITEPEAKIKRRVIEITIFRLLLAPFPFLWWSVYSAYMKWASSFLQAKARARLKFFAILSGAITLTMLWLYFGGEFVVLLSLFFWIALSNAAFKGLLFTWIFFHIKIDPLSIRDSELVASALRNLVRKLRMAEAYLPMYRRVTVIAAMIIFVAVCWQLKIIAHSPFPKITFYGTTENALGQTLFIFAVAGIFDIWMTVFCWNNFKIPDRSELIKSDNTISFREFRDPTQNEFFLGAVGTGYIPAVPLSFDYERFEQNFMIFGAPNMARENMVNWLLMCAFANPNTIAVCLDGGRNDDIAFRHLRGVPGVFIGEINDSLSNTYATIINWVCWLADLADEAFMKRHNVAPKWRPENTRIVVFCDPEVTDIVMKINLRKVGKNRVTGKIKVIWQHPLYDIVEPMQKLFNYGKSHNISFVCVAKHMYHQLSIPKSKRDAFFNIVSHYNIFDILPDGTEGWIKVKTPPFRYTFGVNFRDDFHIATAPKVTNAELADYIRQQWQKANAATFNLWDEAAGEVPTRQMRTQKSAPGPVIRPGVDWQPQPRDMNRDNNGRHGTGGNGKHIEKTEELEFEET